jgi:hypothetical protein
VIAGAAPAQEIEQGVSRYQYLIGTASGELRLEGTRYCLKNTKIAIDYRFRGNQPPSDPPFPSAPVMLFSKQEYLCGVLQDRASMRVHTVFCQSSSDFLRRDSEEQGGLRKISERNSARWKTQVDPGRHLSGKQALCSSIHERGRQFLLRARRTHGHARFEETIFRTAPAESADPATVVVPHESVPDLMAQHRRVLVPFCRFEGNKRHSSLFQAECSRDAGEPHRRP